MLLPKLALGDPAIAAATADTARAGSLPEPPRRALSSACAGTPYASSTPPRGRAVRSARGVSAGVVERVTGHGARVGDLFMSRIPTCELNGANPFDYLTRTAAAR